MQQRAVNKKLSHFFRLRGLQLRPDAMAPLHSLIETDSEWQQTLAALLEELDKLPLKDKCVDADVISTALASISSTGGEPTQLLTVTDIFAKRPLQFLPERKEFAAKAGKVLIHANAQSRCAMLALRLALVEQRVRRHELFKPSVLAHGIARKGGMHLELTSINALLGRKGTRVVLGVLTQMGEGRYILQDSYASVALEGVLTAERHAGFFPSGTIVLVEGEVSQDGALQVKVIGLPPPEPRAESLSSMGGEALSQYSATATGGAAQMSQLAREQSMMVVLSDVWLDSPQTLEKLQVLFAGYEAAGNHVVGTAADGTPQLASDFFVFVLCGNFVSPARARGTARRSAITQLFSELASVLSTFPTLCDHAHFVLVPGPDDPCLGSPDVLPRAPIPQLFTGALSETLRRFHSSSNPARLSLCGQEVVVLREELLAKMRRCSLFEPDESVYPELTSHLVETLVCQAHLCPLPIGEAAVYWQVDPALWLHPAPDALVLAERSSQFELQFNGTMAFNPGSFAGEGSWMVYRPLDRSVEPSSLE